jgi:hypothetical protein
MESGNSCQLSIVKSKTMKTTLPQDPCADINEWYRHIYIDLLGYREREDAPKQNKQPHTNTTKPQQNEPPKSPRQPLRKR